MARLWHQRVCQNGDGIELCGFKIAAIWLDGGILRALVPAVLTSTDATSVRNVLCIANNLCNSLKYDTENGVPAMQHDKFWYLMQELVNSGIMHLFQRLGVEKFFHRESQQTVEMLKANFSQLSPERGSPGARCCDPLRSEKDLLVVPEKRLESGVSMTDVRVPDDAPARPTAESRSDPVFESMKDPSRRCWVCSNPGCTADFTTARLMHSVCKVSHYCS